MGQYSEDGSLGTQARPRFLGEDMAGTIYRPESRYRASALGQGSDDRSGWTFCP